MVMSRLLSEGGGASVRNDELESLYNKYHIELYLYALALCKDKHLAEDLVSETFFKALLALEDSREYVKYWLFRVCKNLYLDYAKKEKSLEQIEQHMNKLFIEESTLDKILINEQRREVYYEVLKLKSSYKEIITLYYYCSLSLREVAVIMRLSEGASRTLLYRARKKLKEGLKEG